MNSLAFGPVPSRRLGRSIGINSIPPKICSYACAYCQVGRTRHQRIDRGCFFDPDSIAASVGSLVRRTRETGERVDYLSIVPDGEPTLDCRLGESIDALRSLGIPIAVISNGSLLWQESVRRDLRKADWVSLKVDSVSERTWRRIDRPHGLLELDAVLRGMLDFRQSFTGCLTTETMLCARINDDETSTAAVAAFLARLKPDIAFLAVPTRPPADASVTPPFAEVVQRTRLMFQVQVQDVRCLTEYEGNSFSCAGEPREALLGITAVHPMRRDAVQQFLRENGAPWSLVEQLLHSGELVEAAYGGATFYRRGPAAANGH